MIAKQIGTHRGAQAELSRRLGESTDHFVSNRVRGKSKIQADDIPRLAKALNVSPTAFFEEEPSVSTSFPLAYPQVRKEAIHYYRNHVKLDPDALRDLGRSLLRLADDLSGDEELGPERDTHPAA